MTHDEVCQLFLKWIIKSDQYKSWYIFQNNTGFASKEKVRYGVPNSGGGADYFAFGPNAITEFFEVKTNKDPTLKPKQKIFRDNMIKQGFKCWVVRENESSFYIVPAEKYRPFAKWPY